MLTGNVMFAEARVTIEDEEFGPLEAVGVVSEERLGDGGVMVTFTAGCDGSKSRSVS